MALKVRAEDYPVGSSIRRQLEAATAQDQAIAERSIDRINSTLGKIKAVADSIEVGVVAVIDLTKSPPVSTGGADLALGRLRAGEMNKTEAAYAETLEQRLQARDLRWYRFEAVKLRLAANTFYTPDFIVLAADGVLEFHEVKGRWHDDARVKIKVAASLYPFRFLAVQKVRKKAGGGWKVERF